MMGSKVAKTLTTSALPIDTKIQFSTLPVQTHPILQSKNSENLQRVPKFYISNEQIRLLQMSLPSDLDGMYEFGKEIFATVFTLTPEARPIFTRAFSANSIEADNLALNKFYLRFVQALFVTVSNLSNMKNVVEPKLYRIGKQHGELRKIGFSPELFDSFPLGIKSAISARLALDSQFSTDQVEIIVEAWDFLAHHMVTILKLGLCAASDNSNCVETS